MKDDFLRKCRPTETGLSSSLQSLLEETVPEAEVFVFDKANVRFSVGFFLRLIAVLAIVFGVYVAVRDLGTTNATWNKLARGQDLGEFRSVVLVDYRGIRYSTDQPKLLEEIRSTLRNCRMQGKQPSSMQVVGPFRMTIHLCSGRVGRDRAAVGPDGVVLTARPTEGGDTVPAFWSSTPMPSWERFYNDILGQPGPWTRVQLDPFNWSIEYPSVFPRKAPLVIPPDSSESRKVVNEPAPKTDGCADGK